MEKRQPEADLPLAEMAKSRDVAMQHLYKNVKISGRSPVFYVLIST